MILPTEYKRFFFNLFIYILFEGTPTHPLGYNMLPTLFMEMYLLCTYLVMYNTIKYIYLYWAFMKTSHAQIYIYVSICVLFMYENYDCMCLCTLLARFIHRIDVNAYAYFHSIFQSKLLIFFFFFLLVSSPLLFFFFSAIKISAHFYFSSLDKNNNKDSPF